jgi:hypothetical protein
MMESEDSKVDADLCRCQQDMHYAEFGEDEVSTLNSPLLPRGNSTPRLTK